LKTIEEKKCEVNDLLKLKDFCDRFVQGIIVQLKRAEIDDAVVCLGYKEYTV
jgi:hypothetical protein